MPEPTSEYGLQKRIVKAVVNVYPEVWLFHPVGGPYQVAGIPDLLLCLNGLFVGMEIKWARPGESREHALSRTTPQQKLHIRKIVQAGGMAGVVTSVSEAMDLCDRAFRKANKREKETK